MQISSGSTAGEMRTDYMNLLITQLRNQNPLDPMSNADMASQLAQLSQLEQMENMSRTFQQVLQAVQRDQATGMIGKLVSFIPSGGENPVSGRIEGIEIVNDIVRLQVNTNIRYTTDDVLADEDTHLDELDQTAMLIPQDTLTVYGYTPDGEMLGGGNGVPIDLHDGSDFLTVGELLHTVTEIYKVHGERTYTAKLIDGEVRLTDKNDEVVRDNMFLAYDGNGRFDLPTYLRVLPTLADVISIRD